MNIEQANNISIEEFLQKEGYTPQRSKPNEIWYNSPIRVENTPSFKINPPINKWYDFGIGEGGGTLDLACKIYNQDVKDTLKTLDSKFGTNRANSFNKDYPKYNKHNSYNKQNNKSKSNYNKEQSNNNQHSSNTKDNQDIKSKNPLKLKEVKELTNLALIKYLKDERGINTDIIKDYVKEVSYTNEDKEFFAIGFKNDSGSYEVRNAYFKGFIGEKKDITTIEKSKTNALVFEGFSDMLSYLSHYEVKDNKTSIIVLNSTALNKKAITYLKDKQFKNIYGFLDNDNTGDKTTKLLQEAIPNFTDKRDIYKEHKDFNSFLTKDKEQQIDSSKDINTPNKEPSKEPKKIIKKSFKTNHKKEMSL